MYDPRKIQLVKNVKNLSAFGGKMSEAIRNAGFSETVARNPDRITDRKWFRENLPDYNQTTNAIADLLNSGHLDHYIFPLGMSDPEIVELIESLAGCKMRKIKHGETQIWAYFWVPDNKGRKDAIDIILKVRGDYAAEKHAIVSPYEGMTDEELDAELAAAEEEKQGRNNNGQ